MSIVGRFIAWSINATLNLMLLAVGIALGGVVLVVYILFWFVFGD